MLTFKHGTQAATLQPGEKWTSTPTMADTYRDTGSAELWTLIRDIEQGTPWRDAVANRYAKTNPWLHQIVTSPKRDLFFRQYPPPANSRILDVGAGWGQIALPLAKAGHTVTALEPTPERLAFIEAAAHQDGCGNRMHFLQADIFDLKFETRFDLITCIGVLEWVPKFRTGDPRTVQIDFLRRLHALLTPGGQLVIGIENRLGLKYLLGANDDHIGAPNIAVYDSDLASKKWRERTGGELRSFTFTETELRDLLSVAGFSNAQFFAALPDYKLPEIIQPLSETNRYLATNLPPAEHDGSNGHPLANHPELSSHYRSFAQLGVANAFVPSFFVIAS